MKIYQIVMKGDARSEQYAEISRKSFEPALDAGIFEDIITFDAITPSSPQFQDHVDKYNWCESLMAIDLSNKNPDDHSPTEKAGMCSHWELMRMQGESNERFFIAEHDTFLLPDQLDNLEWLINYTENYQPSYVNIGLFMGLYSFAPHVAKWQYELMVSNPGTNRHWPINCGPYCNIQRLYRTWCTKHPHEYRRAIHPWHGCDTLAFTDDIGIPFNQHDPDPANSRDVPTTQVISKQLCVTQDHHGYSDEHIEQPWTRHRYFHVVD